MKPMLAATIKDVSLLNFPLMASPKLDGIRALVINGVLVSRNLKPIPNHYVQRTFGIDELNGLDGELIMGDPTDPDAFRKTTSAVMSREGRPEVVFHVFDYFGGGSFIERLKTARVISGLTRISSVVPVSHQQVYDCSGILALEGLWLGEGYEGMMLRDPLGQYKLGRSTLKEQGLMKLKRFEDAEAEILYFEEQLHNSNVATKDALGRTERSNHKAGMVGKDTMGAIRVKGLNGTYQGVEFSVGSGFSDELRKTLWENSYDYVGRTIKVKYFPLGSKDAPRFPTFLGFREDI